MSNLQPEMVKFFSTLIEKESGIKYTEVNQHLLENRIRDVSKTLGFPSPEHFWTEVQQRGLRPNYKELVLDAATNNETSFFRDPELFEFFKNEFIPKFTNANQPLKIWCAASSTGQEPYSLAMILSQLREVGIPRQYEILATDISDRVLKQAQSGLYSQLEVGRGLPPALLTRYFTQSVDGSAFAPKYRIKDELMQHISFKNLNLLESWLHRGPYQIIFCRNVLIYQDIENKKKIIARMANILAPEGFLVLGGAESLIGLSSDFDMHIFGKTCVYRIKSLYKATA